MYSTHALLPYNPILMVVARWRCWTVGGGSAGGGVVAAAVVMAVGGGGGGGGKLCQRASMCMHACLFDVDMYMYECMFMSVTLYVYVNACDSICVCIFV